MKALRGELLVLAGGLLWGFSGACAEYIFTHSPLSAHEFVPWRLFSAGLICLLLGALRSLKAAKPANAAEEKLPLTAVSPPGGAYEGTEEKLPLTAISPPGGASTPAAQTAGLFAVFAHPADLARLALFAAAGIALCQYAYFWGVELSNAAVATVIQYTSPALIIAAECAAERRAPRAAECAALAAILAGSVMLATGGDFSRLAVAPFALFVCALSALGSAAYALLPGQINARYGALNMLGWAMALSGAALLFARGWRLFAWPGAEVFAAICAVILLGTVAAFWLFMAGLARVGAARAGLIASIEPLAAAAIAWAWLGSALSSVQLGGFALIMAGVIMSFRR